MAEFMNLNFHEIFVNYRLWAVVGGARTWIDAFIIMIERMLYLGMRFFPVLTGIPLFWPLKYTGCLPLTTRWDAVSPR